MWKDLKKGAIKYTHGLLHFVYPEYCSSCKILLPEGMNQICLPCEENFRYTYFETYKEASVLDEMFYGRVLLNSTYSMLYFTQNSNTQHIVHEIKYSNNKQLAQVMGERMGKKLLLKWETGRPDVLIPVPLHPKKLHLRGYNQSALISKGISKETKIAFNAHILERRVHTATQTKKGKYDRWDNVEDIFKVNQPNRWKNKHLCIVDDVITTGSTIESCVRILQNSIEGVEVSVISLAIAKK